jgi:hypothetical protein
MCDLSASMSDLVASVCSLVASMCDHLAHNALGKTESVLVLFSCL